MSETPAASSPTKETATPIANPNAKKFEGDGVPFKAKLIGMEDLTIDRDEKICLDSMFKLKAVVRARGEHKQKIQLNLTMTAVKIIDDATKAQIASHEIERISFVVIDPRDTRAFGYIYNTSDDRHQFWAIKTERSAAATVLALKELFELAFEQYSNFVKSQEVTQPVLQSAENTEKIHSPAPSAPTETAPVVLPSEPTLPPVLAPPPPPPIQTPVVFQEQVQVVPPIVQQPIAPLPPSQPVASLIDGDIWGDSPSIPAPKPVVPVVDLFSLDDTPVTIAQVQPPPKSIDPLADFFSTLSTQPTPVQTSSVADNPLLGLYSNPTPFVSQPVQTNPVSSNLYQYQAPPPVISTPPPQMQQNFLTPTPMSPVAPPTVTSPFADLDILGTQSLPLKTTKESFFPTPAPAKTIQQMQMEKQA